MINFPFREPRIDSDIPVWLELIENSTGNKHPGKINGTIINISKGGACLMMPKLILNGTHLFFATLGNHTHSLLLSFEENDKKLAVDSVSARSVWMDSCKNNDGINFKVGVCFAEKQDILFKSVKSLSSASAVPVT